MRCVHTSISETAIERLFINNIICHQSVHTRPIRQPEYGPNGNAFTYNSDQVKKGKHIIYLVYACRQTHTHTRPQSHMRAFAQIYFYWLWPYF